MRASRAISWASLVIVYLILLLRLLPGALPAGHALADEGFTGKAAESNNEKAPGAALAEEEVMKDIIDIRPPVSYGWDRRWLYLLLCIAAVLALIGVLSLRKRRKRRDTFPGFLPPEPEDLVAMNRLRALSSEDALTDREFYFRLSAIARAYLDGRYGLDTMENTTEELLPIIRRLEADRDRLEGLAELFRFSDPVKFASFTAGEARRKADLEVVRNFVHATRRGEDGEDQHGNV